MILALVLYVIVTLIALGFMSAVFHVGDPTGSRQQAPHDVAEQLRPVGIIQEHAAGDAA